MLNNGVQASQLWTMTSQGFIQTAYHAGNRDLSCLRVDRMEQVSCVGAMAGQSQILNRAPFFFKMACKQNLDLRCVLISDPGTLGAGAKTRLESRIKNFTPHCVCRSFCSRTLLWRVRRLCPPIPANTFAPPYLQTPLPPHTPKAVTYHEQSHYCRFMIGHSLGAYGYFLVS